MGLRKTGVVFLQVAGLCVVLSLLAGAALGQPVLLSYVETDSMSPTLEPGDGFVAVPIQVDSAVREGDVIVFRAEELHGGGLTTHRVVEETDRGFVTKGDANPFTDLESGEPPVKRAQIVATALQVDGHVVVVPALGTAIEGTQSLLSMAQRRLSAALGMPSLLGPSGFAYLVFAATLLWYVLGEWRAGNESNRERVTSRRTGVDSRVMIGALAAVLVVGATAAMVVPAGTQEYGVVSAEFDSERPTVIPMGESNNVAYPVANGGFVPVVVFLESASDGVDVRPRESTVRGRRVLNATVTLHAPPQTGHYRRYVTEFRYLAVLPHSVIRGLHAFHPWAPIVAIDALVAIPFYLLGVRVAGQGNLKNRSRESQLSVITRIRAVLTRFY
ncbi:signal peptidase I [Halorubellus salinus]|uniref:signal peptidase I n=1 Tax=Halorubellus salinus TaxID=755309 RepID=UPI001D05D6FC|nr:signal peptidase I [Halorubellus salinus]